MSETTYYAQSNASILCLSLPSGDYNNGLVNCGYYEISGYRHAQSMTMRLCSHL